MSCGVAEIQLSPRTLARNDKGALIKPLWNARISHILRTSVEWPAVEEMPYLLGILDHDRPATEDEVRAIATALFQKGVYTVGIEVDRVGRAQSSHDYFQIMAEKLSLMGFKVVPLDDANLALEQNLHLGMLKLIASHTRLRDNDRKNPEEIAKIIANDYVEMVDALSWAYKGRVEPSILDELFLNEFFRHSRAISQAKNDRELETYVAHHGYRIFKLNLLRSSHMLRLGKDTGAMIAGFGHIQHWIALTGEDGLGGLVIGDDPLLIEMVKNDVMIHVVDQALSFANISA